MLVRHNSTSLCSQSLMFGSKCCLFSLFLSADSEDDFAGQGSSNGLNALAAEPMLDWPCADADRRKTGCLMSCKLAAADSVRACWAEGGSSPGTASLTTLTEHSLGRFRAANTQTASLATWHASSFDQCSNNNAQMCEGQMKALTMALSQHRPFSKQPSMARGHIKEITCMQVLMVSPSQVTLPSEQPEQNDLFWLY